MAQPNADYWFARGLVYLQGQMEYHQNAVQHAQNRAVRR